MIHLNNKSLPKKVSYVQISCF